MKFRAKFLSLAAVSALAATAFVMTGCGSDDSSSASSTPTPTPTPVAGTSTGIMVKGMWAGIPYVVSKNGTATNTSAVTAQAGQFTYAKADNVTFKPGLGVNAKFQSLNSTGSLASNSTQLMYNANEIKQGSATVASTDAQALMTNLATVYAQLGVAENNTNVNATLVSQIQTALDNAYNGNPGYYAAATTAQINAFQAITEKLYTDLGNQGVKAGNGSALTATVAAGLSNTFASNKTQVESQLQTIINNQGAATLLSNAPALGDLQNAMVLAANSNNTVGKMVKFGPAAQSYWVNGTILQNTSNPSNGRDKMIFTNPDYTEGSKVSNGSSEFTYMATLVPYDFATNLGALAFNVTINNKTFAFHLGSTSAQGGWYNLTNSNVGGNWTFNFTNASVGGTAVYTIVTNNDSAATGAAGAATTGSMQVNDTANHTIAFKTTPNLEGRTFIGYYWSKALKFFNVESNPMLLTLQLDSSNVTLNGAVKDASTKITK